MTIKKTIKQWLKLTSNKWSKQKCLLSLTETKGSMFIQRFCITCNKIKECMESEKQN